MPPEQLSTREIGRRDGGRFGADSSSALAGDRGGGACKGVGCGSDSGCKCCRAAAGGGDGVCLHGRCRCCWGRASAQGGGVAPRLVLALRSRRCRLAARTHPIQVNDREPGSCLNSGGAIRMQAVTRSLRNELHLFTTHGLPLATNHGIQPLRSYSAESDSGLDPQRYISRASRGTGWL